MFTKAWNGLKSQGFLPASDGSKCLYRSKDGKKCAFGHLLDDATYRPEMENSLATTVIREYKLQGFGDMDGEQDRRFILALQSAHDNANVVTEGDLARGVRMVEELLHVAGEWNLTPPDTVSVAGVRAYVEAAQAGMINRLPPNCS